MQLILIHGNGLVAISNKVSQIKKEFDPLTITEINGKGLDFEKAAISFSTPNLFVQKRLVVLEDFDPKDDKINLEKLPNEDELVVLLKFNKSLPVTSKLLKEAVLKKAQIVNFTEAEEIAIFPFLEKLADKKKIALSELDHILEEMGGQYLLTMICYLLRRFILIPKKMPEFARKKLQVQREQFDNLRLINLYQEALDTDYKIKNGLMEEKMALTLLVNKILN